MTKVETKVQVLSKELQKELQKLTTKSAQIRYLTSLGYKTGHISKILTEYHGKLVRFQHVYNVQHQIVKGK